MQRPAQLLPEAQFYLDLGPGLSCHTPDWYWGVRPPAACGAVISLRFSSFSHLIIGTKSLPLAPELLWPQFPAATALPSPCA